jgi:hypothetical protein
MNAERQLKKMYRSKVKQAYALSAELGRWDNAYLMRRATEKGEAIGLARGETIGITRGEAIGEARAAAQYQTEIAEKDAKIAELRRRLGEEE